VKEKFEQWLTETSEAAIKEAKLQIERGAESHIEDLRKTITQVVQASKAMAPDVEDAIQIMLDGGVVCAEEFDVNYGTENSRMHLEFPGSNHDLQVRTKKIEPGRYQATIIVKRVGDLQEVVRA
jgi:hypothetical protein